MSLNKVLVVNPFGLGDVIFSFPMIEAIKSHWPKCRIDYIANERTWELVGANPSIEKHFIFDRGRLRALFKSNPRAFLYEAFDFRHQIADEAYDAAIDLSMRREYPIFLALAGIKRRIGFDYKGRGMFLTEKTRIKGFEDFSVRDYYLGLARKLVPQAGDTVRAYPRMKDPMVFTQWEDWLRSAGFADGDLIVAMAPGGGRSWGGDAHYKQWAPERFAAVAKHLAEKHGAKILLLGDGEESALCDKVRREAGVFAAVLAGKTIGQVMWALRRARLFIGNDGGLMHLADLLQVPLAGIYGPVDETVYGPLAGPGRETLTASVPCRPCYHRFRFPPCAHQKRCLTELEVKQVTAACDRLLAAASTAKGI